jgi:hypothetical protein
LGQAWRRAPFASASTRTTPTRHRQLHATRLLASASTRKPQAKHHKTNTRSSRAL